MSDREPPYDEEAERGVLGAIMSGHDRELTHILAECPPAAFYVPKHADIARALQTRAARREATDPHGVWAELRAMKRANAITIEYLFELGDNAVAWALAHQHARHIASLAQRRALVVVLQNALARTNCLTDRFDDVADCVLADVMKATERKSESEPVSMLDLVTREMKRLESAGDQGTPRYCTNLDELDKILVPMEGGQLLLIGGRPSAGKTSLVMHLARAIAHGGGRVLVFSLETTDDRLTRRQLSSVSTVPLRAISDFQVTQQQFNELNDAANALSKLTVWVDHGYDLTLSRLRSKCRRHRARFGLSAIVIDYLQLLQPEQGMGGGRAGSREQEVAAISRGLKRLAKEFNVPVLALSQLNRDSVKGGETRKPSLADLRDSGQLEQDADAVLLAYALDPEARTRIGIVVAKQKDGPVGEAVVGFDPGRTAFRDLSPRELEAMQDAAPAPAAPARRAGPLRSNGPSRRVLHSVPAADDEAPAYVHGDEGFGGDDAS